MHYSLARKPEVRAGRNGLPEISGYAAVFYDESDPGTEYEAPSGIFERVAPGAFDLRSAGEIKSTFNHDANLVLGSTSAGTLRLSVDSVGLRYTVAPPDTATVRDRVIAPIQRGDVSGSSFMFDVPPGGFRFRRDGDKDVRDVVSVRLIEVGPVVFPAYRGTSAGMLRFATADEVSHDLAALEEWRAVNRRLLDVRSGRN